MGHPRSLPAQGAKAPGITAAVAGMAMLATVIVPTPAAGSVAAATAAEANGAGGISVRLT